MDSQLNIDVNNLCRTCLSSAASLRSLSAQLSDSKTIFEALSNVINRDIMISELLPYKICEECESCLYQYDNFKQKCLENEEVIKNWFASTSADKSEDSCCSEDVRITIPYQCAICLDKFMNIIELQDHYANVHVDKNNKVELFYTQERNPVWFATLKQESSEESSSEEESSDGVSDSGNDLTTHSLYNYNNVTTDIGCITTLDTGREISGEVVKCEEIVKFEKTEDIIPLTHNEPSNNKKNDISEIVKNELIEAKFKVSLIEYHCDICDIFFKTVRAIKIHTKRKHGYPLLSNPDVDKQKYAEDELFQCSMCMRKFTKKESLENHLKKHEENLKKIYTCNFCNREFQRKAHLENHIISLHMKEKVIDNNSLTSLHKKHKCKQCGKCFQMLSTLKDHLRVHTGEKPFLCSTCGRGFSQKTNLKEHMRRHQGLKPFKCPMCTQGFVSKGELTSHQRTHTGAHPFLCDICNNGFTTSSSLAKHKRIHLGDKRFLCDLCPMKFTASSTLKNHRRTHTGEKPFSCSHCDKAFVQKNDLVAHTRCHTGERPYVCAVCGQAFRQNSTLRAHTKIHKETPVQDLQLHRNINNIENVLVQQNLCLKQ